MDPAKVIGKLKEQVRMEHKARRSYPKVWAQIADKNTNQFYHQGEIDSQLRDQLKLQGLCRIQHNNEGESRFVSPEMHKNLLAVCRCGRTRQGAHMGKCLQRTLSPDCGRSATNDKTQDNTDQRDDGPPHQDVSQPTNVPRTSNSSIGFLGVSSNYRRLERSMQYVSPAFSMTGPRITAVPYNNIIIG